MKYSSFLGATLLAGFLVNDTPAAKGASFNGLEPNLGNLYRTSDAVTRSISPENFTGEKAKGGMATEGTGKHASSDLGRGWKVSPSVGIKAGTTFTLGEIKGTGLHSANLDDPDRQLEKVDIAFLLGW